MTAIYRYNGNCPHCRRFGAIYWCAVEIAGRLHQHLCAACVSKCRKGNA
jgi:hypothetical protein